jgi:hypothetical protein
MTKKRKKYSQELREYAVKLITEQGEMEWWGETTNIASQQRNAVSLADLVKTLQKTWNLLMWIAGHRHMNTVKAFPSANPIEPEQGLLAGGDFIVARFSAAVPDVRDLFEQ